MLRKQLRTFEENQIKQHHSENQGQKDIKISSLLQRHKIPEGIRISLDTHKSFFPNRKQRKNLYQRNSFRRSEN